MKKPILILTALITMFMSCKVDEAGVPTVQTNSTLLNWHMVFKKAKLSTAPTAVRQHTDTINGFTSKRLLYI